MERVGKSMGKRMAVTEQVEGGVNTIYCLHSTIQLADPSTSCRGRAAWLLSARLMPVDLAQAADWPFAQVPSASWFAFAPAATTPSQTSSHPAAVQFHLASSVSLNLLSRLLATVCPSSRLWRKVWFIFLCCTYSASLTGLLAALRLAGNVHAAPALDYFSLIVFNLQSPFPILSPAANACSKECAYALLAAAQFAAR